jgi:hypothetical protein
MATVQQPPAISEADTADLEQAVKNLMNGVRDPVAMDRSADEMDQGRQEIRQRLGVVNLAVELVREARGDE